MTNKLHTDYEARITGDIAILLIAIHTYCWVLAAFYSVCLGMDIYKGIKAINAVKECKGCGKCQK